MPRIPESELERLKQEIALERLAGQAGIALKRHGQDLLGLCPLPRRPRTFTRHQPRQEPLALPRRSPPGAR